MRILFFSLFCLRLFAALPNEIQIHDGKVSGVTEKGVRIFRGIPYAAPPVGSLRWHAPEPLTPWHGVKAAERFGANCIQNITNSKDPWTSEFMAHGATSEDCLYLNVWTGAASASARRPVFVWIHGGAFNEGSGSIAAYDGEQLARKGLVVVTVNYRMGILGFLVHPELTEESAHNSSGNYGLLDQLAALKWVQTNIAAFGGDPERVTLAGQSAGASSVHALMNSPLAKGFFQRAVAESGSGGRNLRPLKEAEQDGMKFAEAKGARSIEALRSMSPDDLRAGAPRVGPIADGWLLPDTASVQSDVPVLTGMVWDEGSSSASYATSDRAALRAKGMQALQHWAESRANTTRSKVFIYIFDHPEPGPKSALYGVFHTSEVPYVFDSLAKCDRPWTDDDRRIAEMMSSFWVNFAATGNPNGKGLAAWPAFNIASKTIMELGDRNAPLQIP